MVIWYLNLQYETKRPSEAESESESDLRSGPNAQLTLLNLTLLCIIGLINAILLLLLLFLKNQQDSTRHSVQHEVRPYLY